MTKKSVSLDYGEVQRKFISFAFVFSAVMSLGMAWSIWREYREIDRDQRKNAANFTRVLLQHTEQIFANIDDSLSMLAKTIARDPNLIRRADMAWIRKYQADVFGFGFLFVLDSEGRVVANGDTRGLVARDWAPDPPKREPGEDRLFVGPISRSRGEQSTVVPVLRPYYDEAGTFRGWVGATLDAEYLMGYFRDLSDGNLRINLRLLSGEVILRYPHRDDLIGRNLRPVQKIYELVDKQMHGQTFDLSPVEGDQAFYDFRRSERFPYFIVIVRNVARMFAGWRSSAWLQSLVGGGIILSVWALVGALCWQLKVAQEEDRRLAELSEQVRKSSRLQSIGRISSGLARDFNALLTIMFGQTDWIESRLDSAAPARATVGRIRSTLNRARDLVRQVVSLQKPDRHRHQEIRLGEIASEIDVFLTSALPDGISMELDVQDVGLVRGDPAQVYQALLNLCSNGLDAMKGKGGVLRLRVYRDPLGRVVTEIGDDGHGIAPADLDRIFQPFFTTKGHGEGTGMGLPLVRSMAEDHGVLIEVLSREGVGTTFRLTWPERDHV